MTTQILSSHLLRTALIGAALALLLAPSVYAGPCTNTAQSVWRACRNDVAEEFWLMNAACINVSDADERAECRAEAAEERNEAKEECDDQREARLDLCEDLGEARYEPDFEPDDFTTDFNNQNPYFPLAVGNMWVYEEEDATVTVEVQDATKLIEGVTCIVVRDTEEEEDVIVEITDDWYAQNLDGDVYYCGEISENFELFPGDDPEVPELVDIDGSWKTGREGAQPGIIAFANPLTGTVFRQELAYDEAEDAGEILATDYSFGDDPELDEGVPEELAELLCDDDCVVTLDFTPVEPDDAERKYYAPGVGLFLEIDLVEGDVVQLTECNVDPRCDDLPEPEEEGD